MKRLIVLGAIWAMSCSDASAPLVSSDFVTGDAILNPLTSAPGDSAVGEQVFIDRERGHCVLCHVVEGLEAEFQGNVGPDLSDVGNRLDEGQLRLRIVDYQIVRPGTVMPSYYRIHDLYQVEADYGGTPILTPKEVEDLVSYLSAQAVKPNDG